MFAFNKKALHLCSSFQGQYFVPSQVFRKLHYCLNPNDIIWYLGLAAAGMPLLTMERRRDPNAAFLLRELNVTWMERDLHII